MKKELKKVLITGLICMMAFSGCKKAWKFDPDTNAIYVKKDKTIQEAAIGEFAETYYSEEELKTYVNESVTGYNESNGKDKITVSSISVKDNVAKVMMKYQTYEDYQNYNNAVLFVGSISDAIKEGYDFSVDFVDAETNEKVKKDTVISDTELNVIVVSELNDYVINLASDMKYYSDNAVANTKKEVKITKDTLTYIVYK